MKVKNTCTQVGKIIIGLFFTVFLFGCEDFNDSNDSGISSKENFVSNFELQEGTVKIKSKTVLKNILDSYQKSVENQNSFNAKIREIQNKGFRPLTPIFEENDTEKIESFLTRKKERIQKNNLKLGIYSKSSIDEEIEFDDELIADPSLAAILNEDREIYIADSIYKYTETGLYFCLIKDKQKLYNYLSKLSVTGNKQQIANISKRQSLKKTSRLVQPDLTEVSDGIMWYAPEPFEYDEVIQFPTPIMPTFPQNSSSPRLIKQNLEISYIEKNSVFEHIFGASDKAEDYYSDNRRIQVSFWNQNYYVYSSIGCSARLQKRVKILGISGWQKSYAEQIELGINNIQYDYKFNVPPFNNVLYVSGPTVYYEYKGVKYNQYAQVIPSLPTENPGFPFENNTNQNVVDIFVFDNDITLSSTEANKIFDQGLRLIANQLPKLSSARVDLEKGLNNEDMKYNIVKAVPFSNKVTFATMGVKWTNNDDNAITQYFDFNFLLTWKSNYENAGDYLKGLKGATPYSSVHADIYGAALHNGEWKGRRLLTDKIQ